MLVTRAGLRLLSENQIKRYHEDGFVIPDFRLSEQTLDDIRATHDRLVRRHPKFVDYCPAVLGYDLGFLNFARNPEILDMVAQVIGDEILQFGTRASLPNPRVVGVKPRGIKMASTGPCDPLQPAVFGWR